MLMLDYDNYQMTVRVINHKPPLHKPQLHSPIKYRSHPIHDPSEQLNGLG